eukprot:12186387-Heterocapsa_arctica.AAC.1
MGSIVRRRVEPVSRLTTSRTGSPNVPRRAGGYGTAATHFCLRSRELCHPALEARGSCSSGRTVLVHVDLALLEVQRQPERLRYH